jgi:hypothetical protein
MSAFRQWVVQLRYPYTAGIIGVVWIGTALFTMVATSIDTAILILLVAGATVVVVAIGFSSAR